MKSDLRTTRHLILAGALLALAAAPVGAATCGLDACDVTGTSGDDNLSASAAGDVVCGLGGNDTITGHSGVKICGDDGHDWIEGLEGGHDQLWGGAGDDVIFGEYYIPSFYPQPSGTDTILGRSGNDDVYAQGGNDVIWGGGGNDELHGMDGDDEVYGQGWADVLTGGAGYDTLDGGDSVDECYTGEVYTNCEVF